jgi:hypothetical protein
MDTKSLEIACPCCESRLEIDVRTGKIVRWARKTELDESGKPRVRESDWGQASQKVQERLGGAADKFDQSLSREKSRGRDLDELFKKASDKLKKKDDA